MSNLYQKLTDLDFTLQRERAENGAWYWLGDRGDMSVGICPVDVTPFFNSEAELMAYLETNAAKEYAFNALAECFGIEDAREWLND